MRAVRADWEDQRRRKVAKKILREGESIGRPFAVLGAKRLAFKAAPGELVAPVPTAEQLSRNCRGDGAGSDRRCFLTQCYPRAACGVLRWRIAEPLLIVLVEGRGARLVRFGVVWRA